MTLWQDGMANSTIGLDNRTNLTVSRRHMIQQSPSSTSVSSLSYSRDLAASPSGHICLAEPGCTSHFLSNPPSPPHWRSLPFETNADLTQKYVSWTEQKSSNQHWLKALHNFSGKKKTSYFCERNTSHRPPNVSNFNQQLLALVLSNVLLNTKLSCPPSVPCIPK